MKVRVKFTVELNKAEREAVLRLARELGHDFDNPKPRIIIQRFLEESGTGGIMRAVETVQEGV